MTRVIAEIGVNHEGDIDRALSMIDDCAEQGVWAVKFQLFVPELLDARPEKVRQLHGWTLNKKEWMRCRRRAAKHGLAFGASCFDDPSVELLRSLGADFQKVACGQRWPTMKWVAPLHFESYTRSMTPRPGVIPLLCVPKYHANLKDYLPIPFWARGISDHTGSPRNYPYGSGGSSLARGFEYAEVHVTDRSGVPDEVVSWLIGDLKHYMDDANHVDTSEPVRRTRVELDRPINGQRVAWLRGVDA